MLFYDVKHKYIVKIVCSKGSYAETFDIPIEYEI